ncbi:MAG: hypothetical protein AAF616_05645 [Bacteroidota bacterium]
MKKFTQNLLLLTAASLLVFSCGEDEEPTLPSSPILLVSASAGPDSGSTSILLDGGSVPQGDSVFYSLDLNAAGGIDNLRVGTQILSATDLGLQSGETTAEVTSLFQLTASATPGAAVSTQFVLVDDSDQRDTVVFEYTIADPRSPEVQSSTQILIGGFQNATLGSFYNAVEDSVYTSADALMNDEKIDLLFYYSSAANYTIAALDNPEADATIEAQTGGDLDNFDPQNPTRFKTFLTAPDFDGVSTLAELESAYAGDADLSTQSRITDLNVGDIFGFILASSRGDKVGLIKVVATTGTQGSDRAIEIEVKIAP